MPLTVLLNGAKGRMGRAIAAVAPELDARIGAATDAGDDPAAVLAGCDVIVDFSSPQGTEALLELAVARGVPLVIGTTGHAPAEKQRLLGLAARASCVWAGNFSVGVNLLFALVGRAASVLGEDFDIEVMEMHHRFKQDAPSGTAERLLEIILEKRKLNTDALRHHSRGIPGPRSRAEVGVHALRGGDVVGDHTVVFAGIGERIELTHKAGDRAIFARGALRAAHWVVKRKPGVYDMQDVLGLG